MSLFHTRMRRYRNWRRRCQRWFGTRHIGDQVPYDKLSPEEQAKATEWIGAPNMQRTRKPLSRGDYAFWCRHNP